MRKRLTDQFVRSVKPSGGQANYWDETPTGFGLRVSTKGKKTFQILYRHNRRQRRMALGPFPVLSLADARKLAKQMLGDAARGLDPASLKSANRNAETFAQLAADYLTLHAKRRKRSWREDERIITGELLPWWKSRKAKDIMRRDIQEVVQRIAERAPIMANRTLSLIRQVFHFGVNNAWFDLNPCQRIDKPGIERQRQRVLDVDEIQKLWNVLEHDTTTAGTILMLHDSLGDIPMLGDMDGDHRADLVVWRESTGTWFWLTSMSGYNYAAQGQKQWGASGDIPMIP